jgi:hypothetical protein
VFICLRVGHPTDRELPTCERIASSGLTLLFYYGVQSGTFHVECICVGRDTVSVVEQVLRAVPYSHINLPVACQWMGVVNDHNTDMMME